MAIKWASAPSEDDIQDAKTFLLLVWQGAPSFSALPNREFLAKDILRASALQGLPATNAGVRKYLERFESGETISPVLLIAGSLQIPRALFICEGYHRVSAAYILDEKTPIRSRLAVIK